MHPPDYTLYHVTDAPASYRRDFLASIEAAIAGGVTIVQYRAELTAAKNKRELYETGAALRDLLKRLGVPLIINDHADLALALDADGVHIGQTDLPATVVRRLIGPRKLLGLSVTTPAQIRAAAADPAAIDYLGLSPVFATPTKPDAPPAIGLAALPSLVALSHLPAVAIGGITLENAAAIFATGVAGIAVVTALSRADDPRAAAQTLRAAAQSTTARNATSGNAKFPLGRRREAPPQTAKKNLGAPRTTTDAAHPFRTPHSAIRTPHSAFHMIPNILTIAGVDPSGGAGVFADLKTFSALGAYGMGVVTALTAQNTQGVTAVHPIPVDFIAQQIDTLFADVRVDAVKLGMLGTPEIARTVAAALRRHNVTRLVVDPVMVAKSGHHLLAPEAINALRREIVPLAEVLTPNLPEAEVLLGPDAAPIKTLSDMRHAARALLALGPRIVILKGGHLAGSPESPDIIDDGSQQIELHAPRHPTKNTHGTGCTLSAAIAALLPRRTKAIEAIRDAKNYLTHAIAASEKLAVGSGHGPVHHFWKWWKA